MKDIFKNLVIDFQSNFGNLKILPRELKISLNLPISKAITIYGPRRSGKSWFLYYVIKQMLESNAQTIENIVFINFEDNRLIGLKAENLDIILQAYWELFPGKTPVLFLDEIQNIPEWSKWVRKLVDLGYKVFVTGSNSRLLSKEIATELGGRTFTFLLLPWSLGEYLTFKQTEITATSLYDTKQYQTIQSHIGEYLNNGGFPEVIFSGNAEKNMIFQDYLNTLVYRDVMERYNIRNTTVLKLLINYCLQSYASVLSVNRFYSHLKSRQIKTGKDVLYEYLGYLEEAMFIFQIAKNQPSVLGQEGENKKLYLTDIGYNYLYPFSNNTSRVFENMLFLELRRIYQDVFYYRNGFETDFIIPGEEGLIIQACIKMDKNSTDKTYEREIQSTLRTLDNYGKNEAIIVTLDEKETIEKAGKNIKILPLQHFYFEYIMPKKL